MYLRSLRLTALALTLALGACHAGKSRLEDRVKAQLRDEPAATHVTAAVGEDGMVTLRGVIRDEMDRIRLENAVHRVPGVLAVQDQLVLLEDPALTGGAVADPSYAERVAAAAQGKLHEAKLYDLHVSILDGVATVGGAVDRGRHDEALRIVRETVPLGIGVNDETVVR